MGDVAILTACVARGNTGTAMGLAASNRSLLSRCVALSNGGNGINLGAESHALDCVSSLNGGVGINFSGILGRASGCTTSSNGSHGIFHNNGGAIIERCHARVNGGTGIGIGQDGLVTQCTVIANAEGITATAQSVISGNISNLNDNGVGTAAGIRVSSSRVRIEGNSCSNNNVGIAAAGSLVLVIRNQCSTNTTNYSLAGSGAGPLVTEANVATNTNPHANFDF